MLPTFIAQVYYDVEAGESLAKILVLERVLRTWLKPDAYFGERAHPFRSIAPTCA